MSSAINFPIVDPHIHQWDPYGAPHEAALLVKLLGRCPDVMYRLVKAIKPRSAVDAYGLLDYVLDTYLPRDYALDIGPFVVESVVHVEAHWAEQKGLGPANETKWVSQLPFEEEGITLGAIVAGADPSDVLFPKLLAANQANSPLFTGIRKMASYHEDPGVLNWHDAPNLYGSKSFLKGFERLANANLSFDAWAYSHQLEEIEVLVKTFPDTNIVIDHLASPVGVFGPVGRYTGRSAKQRSDIFKHWQEAIARFADAPNAYAKISGLLMPVLGHAFHRTRRLASVDELVNTLSPMIEHAMSVFGSERLMFASNFPMDKVSASLSDIIVAYEKMVVPFGTEAVRQVFRDNARHFYNIR